MTVAEWGRFARRASEARERMPRPALWALDLATAGAAWGYGAMALRGFFGPLSLFLLPVLWAGVLLVLYLTLRSSVGLVGVLRRALGHLGGRLLEGDAGPGPGGFGGLAGAALDLTPKRRRRARLSALVALGGPAGLFISLLPWVLQALCVLAVVLHLGLKVAGPFADRAGDGSVGAGGAGSGDEPSKDGVFPEAFPSPHVDSRGPRRKE